MTQEEVERVAGEEASAWMEKLVDEKRAGRLTSKPAFWIAAERLPMIRTIYPACEIEPPLVAPLLETRREWERSDAVRELVRGRIEVSGPITAQELAELFQLSRSEIDAALLAIE